MYLMEEEPDADTLKKAIRRTVIANTFIPVFMGSAYKNKWVLEVEWSTEMTAGARRCTSIMLHLWTSPNFCSQY